MEEMEEPERALRMNKEEALQQYEYEKQLFEQWGGTSIITFKEWLEIKSIVLADEEERNHAKPNNKTTTNKSR